MSEGLPEFPRAYESVRSDFSLYLMISLRSYIKHSTPGSPLKNSVAPVFLTHFSEFGNPDATLFFVFA